MVYLVSIGDVLALIRVVEDILKVVFGHAEKGSAVRTQLHSMSEHCFEDN
jgi:hypothetical protein